MQRVLMIVLALISSTVYAAERSNVLFVAIDDLRPDLGCYGVAHAKTPHIDAFAANARIFNRHYVQVPTCGASRACLLSGRYPSAAAHLTNDAIARSRASWKGASLPAWFKDHGYRTLALGKITHYPGGRTGTDWVAGPEELPNAWERSWLPETPWKTPQGFMHGYANGAPRTVVKGKPFESVDGPDETYPDGHLAAEAVRQLKDLAKSDRPWLLAVGLMKPHLPFAAPKKYFDLFDPAAIPPPTAPQKPDWPSTWHNSGEFRRYLPAGIEPETDAAYAAEVRRAYAASIAFADAQLGKILEALKEIDPQNKTIVVLWGDHGFLVGEHGIWGKHCLFEGALRAPLLIRTPNLAAPGQVSNAVVETVDIFPTLADLCALPEPGGIDGRTLRPQLADPAIASAKPATSYWGQARSVRTDQYRLTLSGKSVELYDYKTDPGEIRNHAADQPELVKKLQAQLRPPIAGGAEKAE